MHDAEIPHDDPHEGAVGFVVAAFALLAGLTIVLDRVGAPAGLVKAIQPSIVLLGLAALGLWLRAANLSQFLAARRRLTIGLSALAVAVTAGACLRGLGPWSAANATLASLAGIALSALVVGPAARRLGAASLSDVLSTRFPFFLARLAFAAAIAAVGVLLTAAGFELAVRGLAEAVVAPRRVLEGLICATLIASLAPGGFNGLVWGEAAIGGAMAIILAVAVIAGAATAPIAAGLGHAAELASQTVVAAFAEAPPLAVLALAPAIASLAPLIAPELALPNAQRAASAGLGALALLAVGAVALAIAGEIPPRLIASAPGMGLSSASELLFGLALARGGVLSATRAPGYDVARAHIRLSRLASVRLARLRLTIAFLFVAIAVADDARLLDPQADMTLALSISLATVAPALGLALTTRLNSLAGLAACLVGAGVFAAFALGRLAPAGLGLEQGLASAALGLAAGFVVGAPHRRWKPMTLPKNADPFSESPFDNVL